jgi:hypothetical protein
MKRSKIASRFERVKTIAFFWALAARALHVLAPGALAQASNAPRSHNSGRWLKALFLVFLFTLASVGRVAGQGSRKDDIVFNSRGVPLAGATVRVCVMPASGQPCTPLALIYSDAALTQALANPTTTDGLGNYFFYAAPGKYEIEFSGPGITTKQIPNVILPSDPTSPNFSSISSTGGISAFSLNLTGNLTVNGNTTVVGNLASGTLNLANQSTAPGAAGTGTVNLYTKTADKRLYYKDDTGTEIGPIANTTGAQTNVTNTFTAPQNFDANLAFKGPNPWFDITRYGGYSSTGTAPSTTGNITSGTATLTLTAAQDFANGQGIVVYGAGAAPTMTTPGTPTVTPAGILNGATTYNYKIIAEDRLGGLTAASAQGSTTTGAATIGVNSVTLTQGVRTGGVTTYTSSANHNFQAGTTVNITGFNGGLGTFFNDMNGTKVIVATPTSTTFTVNDATLSDRTDSSGGTGSIQACNILTYASASYSGVTTLRYWIYRNTALVGVAPGQDPFYIDCGITAGSPPAYVPAAPPAAATPEYLVSTIVSGGGTTTLTLANNAGTTVSAKTVLHDNSLPLKAAAQAAFNNGGGTVYIPATVLGATFPFNATTDFTTGISNGGYGVRILINNALTLNQTVIPRQGMDFEGMPESVTSFSYVPAAPIGGSAHPFFYLTEGNGNLHFNRLQFNLGPALQSAIFADNGTDGGGTVGIISDDVYFMGNNGTTRPVVLKGGFDFFFKRGECSAGNNVWPITYCVELTDSSPALTGANTPQIPGRVEWAGGTFVNTGVLLDSLPNNSFGGGTHIAFSRILFESAVAPFARINMNNGSGFTSQWVFNDVLGADLAVSVGTPFIDGTNSSNLQRVTWLDGLTAAGNQPLYVNGTPGSSTSFYVARPPSTVISNVPYTSADTASEQLSNANIAATNGGRFFYQMATPAAPGLAVSAGGSVPTGTRSYLITAADADGFQSTVSTTVTATTSSGNQTVTLTPPTLPVGAVAWFPYRDGAQAATPGCAGIAPGMSFVDTFSFTCGTSVPVARAGSSILSNTGIHASALNSGNYNGVRAVCNASGTSVGWAGADVSAWINAAIADIVASGGGKGTVDARSCTGNQTISQEIDVGNNANTTDVSLLLPSNATWNITITDGVSCGIKQFSASSIVGAGSNTGSVMLITGSASANLNSFYCTDPSPVGGGSYVRAEGFQLYNPNGSTVSAALMNVQKVYDNSVFRGITIANYSATDGLRVYSACCGTSFYNITSNSNNTGKRPVFVQADSSTRNTDVSFYSLSADHPGSGFSSIEISGGATAPTDAVNTNINFYGLYTEDFSTNPDTAMKIADARGVNIYGWMNNASATPNASYVGLDISQTAANQLRNVDVYGYKYQAGSGGNGINNHITGKTYLTSTAYQPHYFYGGSSGPQASSPSVIEDNELDIRDSSGTLQYQFPTNGAAVFAGSPVSRAIASGSSTLGSSAIASLACATVVTTAASGAATTDAVEWSFASAPATADGLLEVTWYVTSGNVNWKVCNPTASSQTPSGLVVNWRVVR